MSALILLALALVAIAVLYALPPDSAWAAVWATAALACVVVVTVAGVLL